MGRPLRVLIAKPGLDGHDQGAKVVALALRDAGCEVIYTGLHKSVEEIVEAALQEDVDVVGVSVLSGAHISTAEKLLRLMRERGIGDRTVVFGGTIPSRDIPRLKALGVSEVLPGGTPLEKIVEFVKGAARRG